VRCEVSLGLSFNAAFPELLRFHVSCLARALGAARGLGRTRTPAEFLSAAISFPKGSETLQVLKKSKVVPLNGVSVLFLSLTI